MILLVQRGEGPSTRPALFLDASTHSTFICRGADAFSETPNSKSIDEFENDPSGAGEKRGESILGKLFDILR